jgi:hypothetical protein
VAASCAACSSAWAARCGSGWKTAWANRWFISSNCFLSIPDWWIARSTSGSWRAAWKAPCTAAARAVAAPRFSRPPARDVVGHLTTRLCHGAHGLAPGVCDLAAGVRDLAPGVCHPVPGGRRPLVDAVAELHGTVDRPVGYARRGVDAPPAEVSRLSRATPTHVGRLLAQPDCALAGLLTQFTQPVRRPVTDLPDPCGSVEHRTGSLEGPDRALQRLLLAGVEVGEPVQRWSRFPCCHPPGPW